MFLHVYGFIYLERREVNPAILKAQGPTEAWRMEEENNLYYQDAGTQGQFKSEAKPHKIEHHPTPCHPPLSTPPLTTSNIKQQRYC